MSLRLVSLDAPRPPRTVDLSALLEHTSKMLACCSKVQRTRPVLNVASLLLQQLLRSRYRGFQDSPKLQHEYTP